MSEPMTEREAILTAELEKLKAAQQSALVSSIQGGVFEGIWRAINNVVPPWLAVMALAVFLGHHAMEYYMNAQIKEATKELTEAQSDVETAKAAAENAIKNGSPLRLAKAKADLKEKQEQARNARAEADALNSQEHDATVRIETVEAEIAGAQQKARLARLQADAKAKKLGGGETLENRLAQAKLRLAEMEGAWNRYASVAFSNGQAAGFRAACDGNDFGKEIGCPAQ